MELNVDLLASTVKEEPDEKLRYDWWLKNNLTEKEEIYIKREEIKSEETLSEDSFQCQNWAKSFSATLQYWASKYAQLAIKVECQQKRISDLTNQNDHLLAENLVTRQENERLKDELTRITKSDFRPTTLQVGDIKVKEEACNLLIDKCMSMTPDSVMLSTSTHKPNINKEKPKWTMEYTAGLNQDHSTDSLAAGDNFKVIDQGKTENIISPEPPTQPDTVKERKRGLILDQPISAENLQHHPITPMKKARKVSNTDSNSSNSCRNVQSKICRNPFYTGDRNVKDEKSEERNNNSTRKELDPLIGWMEMGETTLELQQRGTPLTDTCIKIGRFSFNAFMIKAVKMALESTEVLSNGLSCADMDKMQQGSILLVKDVYNPFGMDIDHMASGFQLGDIQYWTHLLVAYTRKGDQYQFITSHSKYQTILNLRESVTTLNLCAAVFYEDTKMQEPLKIDNDKVYVHVAIRHVHLYPSGKTKAKELLIIKIYNDEEKQYLENSAAYQFYIPVKDNLSLEAAPMQHMPHPQRHSLACKHSNM